MTNIVIIDYGMGNLRSAQKGFEHVGFPAKVSSDPDDILKAGYILLLCDSSVEALYQLKKSRIFHKPQVLIGAHC